MGKMTPAEAGMLGYEKSKECFESYRQRRVEEAYKKWEEEDKHCPQCGKRMPYEKRKNLFCNNSCKVTYNNLKGLSYVGREKLKRYCLTCGNSIDNPRSETKFCSNECFHEYRWETETIPAFERGEIASPRRVKSVLLRIRIKDGIPYCENCNNTHWKGQSIPLETHHIDGDSANNFPENLQLLCPNCHALTDTYKNRNSGNGRHYRRERYKEGKPY